MSFADLMNSHIRLHILLLLETDSGYDMNEYMLRDLLKSKYGDDLSRDKLRTEASWLAEQNLVTVGVVGDDTRMISLTPRGVDVSRGRTIVPGVKRPEPGLC